MRSLRESKGISQTELAKQMSELGWPWHQSTVYRAEAGIQPLGLNEAEDLAGILGASVDQLTRPVPETEATEAVRASASAVMMHARDISRSVAALLAARKEAEAVLEDAGGSQWPRVRELREDLTAKMRLYTLEFSVEHGTTVYEAKARGENDTEQEG